MEMKFWKFWTILILVVAALIIGHVYFGLFSFVLTYDQTYISFINIGLLLVSHCIFLKKHLTKDYSGENKMLRYMRDTAVSLGLIGTLIGIMIVLWSAFGPGAIIDPTDVATMTATLANIAQGMSAAIITSLSGILVSVVIGLQLVFLEE